MIVGADAASDGDIVVRASQLYTARLRRVYYSAFSPIPMPSGAAIKAPALMRAPRLPVRMADALYGFTPKTWLRPRAPTHVPLDIDPKLAWARSSARHFAMSSRAERAMLRVPGLGPRRPAHPELAAVRKLRSTTWRLTLSLQVRPSSVRPTGAQLCHRPRRPAYVVAPKREQLEMFAA